MNNDNGTKGFEELGDDALAGVSGGGVFGAIKNGYNAYKNSSVGRYFTGVSRRAYEAETGQKANF